ncbi:uncharacterized protein LOC134273245 [Saccostrea cucullata]|uniref:uncharacterized protein LOC134273245 n=1 Tax=Saccostrea cuccullata TaxID=36930 RepID=UPI002ED4DDBA
MDKGRTNRINKTDSKCDKKSGVPVSVSDSLVLDHSYGGDGEDIQVVREEETYSVQEDEKRSQWRVGRRVVELGVLADGLSSCQLCGQPLQLSNCVGENKFGLAHVLLIKCQFTDCRLMNEVPTDSQHQTPNGRNAWDVNTKLAAGMLNEGFGETHVNSLLAALNIPSVSRKTLKNREREVGQQLGQMAEETCNKSLQEEMKL